MSKPTFVDETDMIDDNVEEIDTLTRLLKSCTNAGELLEIYHGIMSWGAVTDPDFILGVFKRGLKTEEERLSFRDFLISEKAIALSTLRLKDELTVLAEATSTISAMFKDSFKDYGWDMPETLSICTLSVK